MNVTMMETLQVLFYISIIVACLFVYFNRLFYFLAHLASMEGGDRRMTRPACHPLLCCLRRGKFLSRQRSLMPAKSNLIKMAQKFTNHASRMAYVVHRTHLSSTPGDTSAFNHIFVDFITWS